MTFNHFNRRLHLYLALSLLPWFFMYGISSIPFSHARYFQQRERAEGTPMWKERFSRPYDVPVPADGDLRSLGARVLKDSGVQGAFGVYRQNPNQINVYVHTFRSATQLKYFLKEKRLVAEDRRFRFEHFLTGMHARGGFEQETALNDAWAVGVDLVCLAMLVWVATGLYMWWKVPSVRAWGWLALLSGAGSFVLFLWRL